VQLYSQNHNSDMTEKDLSYVNGHRERLRQKFLETRLVDYELMELLLMYAIPRVDVKPIVKNLLKEFGTVTNILCQPIEELTRVHGVGQNTAIFLKALMDVTKREHAAPLRDNPVFYEPSILENYAKIMFAGKMVEEFHVLYLDGKYKLLRDDVHSSGTIDWAAIYPREVVRIALNVNASAVILMHNHPSGNANFSTDDMKVTRELQSALNVVGIQLYDHILVAGGIVFSAKNMQMF
ncbi:MAG: DNA repair protein RadC, partial [Alphaproteobacteria bacterium]|nr:DNA repair protein RadC [Alphaproteobacteria bacterium]